MNGADDDTWTPGQDESFTTPSTWSVTHHYTQRRHIFLLYSPDHKSDWPAGLSHLRLPKLYNNPETQLLLIKSLLHTPVEERAVTQVSSEQDVVTLNRRYESIQFLFTVNTVSVSWISPERARYGSADPHTLSIRPTNSRLCHQTAFHTFLMTSICSSLHSGLFFFALTKNSITFCSSWSVASGRDEDTEDEEKGYFMSRSAETYIWF